MTTSASRPAGLLSGASSAEIRDSMPVLLTRPLTRLTGKPRTGERPGHTTPTRHLVNAVVSIAAGLTVSALALGAGGWALLALLPGWAMTLHGQRNLRMMIFHQAAHRNMWARRRPDRIVGRVVAGVLMVQDFEAYSTEHVQDHHAIHHMTVRDPTVQVFLLTLRMRAGMPSRQMWRILLRTLVNPVFHLRFAISRVRSYVRGASRSGRWITAGAYLAVAAAATLWHGWIFLLVAWFLPLTLFYQVSNTLRLCVKHTFPPAGTTERRGKAYFGSLTNAIFLGEPAPSPGLRGPARAAAWLRWWCRMLLVHFPARYLVLTGDTVCHDFHHRYPMSRSWADYIYERQRDIDAGHPGWPPYREVWGLVPAIGVVFDSLSAADPELYDPALISGVEDADLFTAFDD
ncbi:fatty acid desaturase [Streptomyces griseoincarnatus]